MWGMPITRSDSAETLHNDPLMYIVLPLYFRSWPNCLIVAKGLMLNYSACPAMRGNKAQMDFCSYFSCKGWAMSWPWSFFILVISIWRNTCFCYKLLNKKRNHYRQRGTYYEVCNLPTFASDRNFPFLTKHLILWPIVSQCNIDRHFPPRVDCCKSANLPCVLPCVEIKHKLTFILL